MLDNKPVTVTVWGSTWHFSPRARKAIRKYGFENGTFFEAFAHKVLTMDVLEEGEIELEFYALGVRIRQDGHVFTVSAHP